MSKKKSEPLITQSKADPGPVTSEESKHEASAPVKAHNFKKTAKKEIENSYENIVKAFAKRASEGSVQHTKLLFDLGGVKEEIAKPGRRRSTPTLGKYLLKEAIKLGYVKQDKAKLPHQGTEN